MGVTNRPCPKCRELGKDSTGDHLYLLEDGYSWYCNKPYHPPYLESSQSGTQVEAEEVIVRKGMTPEQIEKYVREVAGYQVLGNCERGITAATHEAFRVRTEVSPTDRSPIATFYPEFFGNGMFGGYKKRKLPKQFASFLLDKVRGSPDFFGQNRCPASGRKLLICAGEEDTMAAYQMLKERYPEYEPCVLGLPRGEGGSAETIADRLGLIRNFEEVIVATDMDEAGKKALASIVPLLGEGTKHLSMSENDINEMLIKGKQKEFFSSYFNAREYRPANIVDVSDIIDSSIERVNWGLSYPWDGLTQLTYGIKEQGEIIGLGAAPGAGKSTIWQMIQKHLLFKHRQEIAIFDIEEGASMGLKKLIGSCMNLPIHKPDTEYDISKAKEIGMGLDGLAHFYDGDSESWDEVEEAIRYYASKGIRIFFIDPLSAMVEHLSASEGNMELGKIMRSMRKMRKHQGLTFFHSNHLNNPSTGKEHGEGGAVRGSQFSGSRAQWKYSTLLLGAERNQYAEEDEKKNEVTLRVLKDRLGGNTGFIKLDYLSSQGVLVEQMFDGDMI